MKVNTAIKRLRQETCPATYNQDFDKEECLKSIENEFEKIKSYLEKWNEQLAVDGVNSKGMVRADIQYLLKEITDEPKS